MPKKLIKNQLCIPSYTSAVKGISIAIHIEGKSEEKKVTAIW